MLMMSTITESKTQSIPGNREMQVDPWEAARVGDLKAILNFIDMGGNVNHRDTSNNTPLHWACQGCHFDIVGVLMSRGAQVDPVNDMKSTPLHYSAREGNLNIVSGLINFGANLEARNKDNLSALHVAAGMGRSQVAKALLNNGADIEATDTASYTPLWRATYYGHPETVKVLVDSGANILAKNKKGKIPGSVFAPNVELAAQQEIRYILGVASSVGRDIRRDDEFSMASNTSIRPYVPAFSEAEVSNLRAALEEKEKETAMLQARIHEITAELRDSRVPSISDVDDSDDGSVVNELRESIRRKQEELMMRENEVEILRRKNEAMARELRRAQAAIANVKKAESTGCNIKPDFPPRPNRGSDPEFKSLRRPSYVHAFETVVADYSAHSHNLDRTSSAVTKSDETTTHLSKTLMLTQREIIDRQKQFTALRRVRADHAASLVQLEDNLKAMRAQSNFNYVEETRCYCSIM